MLADKLKIGDTIGVIAPDKALFKEYGDDIALEKAIKFFEDLGLKVLLGKYLWTDVYNEDNYCAGTKEERAEDINNMFSNKEVKAIFSLKGGDVVNELLPLIDYENIKKNPKIFLGMSDLTILLCAIYKMTGLITFHCTDFINYGKDSDESEYAVCDYDRNEIIDKLFYGNKTILPYDDRLFLNFKEKVVGKSFGTNDVSILKLIGTSYQPDFFDSILFIEGYRTNLMQWKSYITQYKQAGLLSKAIVYGYCFNLEYQKEDSSKIDELLKYTSFLPCVKTNDFGHRHANSIIPIGVDVELDPDNKRIRVLEDYLK